MIIHWGLESLLMTLSGGEKKSAPKKKKVKIAVGADGLPI